METNEPSSELVAPHRAILGARSNSVALVKSNGPVALKPPKPVRKGFSLVEFDKNEEDRERDSVRLVLQKYTGLLRFLFDKFTVKHEIKRRMEQVRSRVISERVLSLTELMKMFREHNMDHSMLNKHEF